jgi:hypothetical protein
MNPDPTPLTHGAPIVIPGLPGTGDALSATVLRYEGICDKCGGATYWVETEGRMRVVVCASMILRVH